MPTNLPPGFSLMCQSIFEGLDGHRHLCTHNDGHEGRHVACVDNRFELRFVYEAAGKEAA